MRGLTFLLLTSVFVFTVFIHSEAQETPDQTPLQEGASEEIDLSGLGPISDSESDRRYSKISVAAYEAIAEGNRWWSEGDTAQSIRSYQRAVNLEPTSYTAQFNLGFVLLQTKQYRRAEYFLTSAVKLKPMSEAAWKCLGFAHHYQKEYQESLKAFTESNRLAPQEAVSNSNLGFAYLFVERYQDAMNAFRNALRIDPAFKPAKNGMCSSHALAKKLNDVIRACTDALAGSPNSAVPSYYLGIAYMDLGLPAKALDSFKTAARLEPNRARIFVGLGFAYFKLRKYQEALDQFNHAREMDENAPYALSGIGAAYAQLKEYTKAEQTLQLAISSNSEDAVSRYNLGIVCLAKKNRDCALSQYNYLKIMDHPLGRTLFTTLFKGRVVEASAYKKP